MDKKKFIPVIVIVLLVTGYLVYKFTGNSSAKEVGGSGTIEVTEVEISSKLAGKIEALKVDEGDYVKAGQQLVVLAYDELKAQLASSKEQVKLLETQLKNYEDNYKRAKELLAAGGYSQQAYDRDETLYNVTKHQYESAIQQLNNLKAQADNAYMNSPINGVVLQKNAELGEIVSPGMSVLTIGDIGKPWLKIYVPESKIGRIKLGDTATVTIDTFEGRKFTGKVTYISSKAEFTPKNVQTKEDRVRLVYAVKIALENKEGIFKPGMPADAVVNVSNN